MQAVSSPPAYPVLHDASATSQAVVQVRGVHKSYDTVEALRDIDPSVVHE